MDSSHKGLERKLGLFAVINIVIANIIGAGIFTTTGFLMEYLANPVLMLSLWGVGGIIAFCGAIAFGELGAAFPEAGGEYIFISKLFNPLLGFLSGWLSLIVGFSAPIAASAIGFSKYFVCAFPNFKSWLMVEGTIAPDFFDKLLAVSIILVFTLIHSRGMVFGSKIQNVLTILKVLLVAGLVVFGLTLGHGSLTNFASTQTFHLDFARLKSIGLSVMFIMFAYSGWNSATYIGSEIRNPRKVIPRSLLISSGVVLVIYFCLNFFFVYAIPPHEIVGEPEIASIAVRFAFGETASTVISLLVSFALFSSLSAFIILGPRVYFRMAKDGYFFNFVAKIHTKYKVPVNAIILQSVIAIILVFSGTFEQILIYMGFALGIFPILAVCGVFKLRMTDKSKLKLPGYPLVHIVFIGTGILMLVLAFFERPVESSVAILTALSGIPVFYWFKRRKN